LLTGELALTAMFISHVCLLVALFFLHRLALLFDYSVADADRAIFYLALFPTSHFLSLPMTESMFLACTICSFYFAKREKWLAAALFGILASTTRQIGLVLLPALAVLYWETYRPLNSISKLRKSGLALLLIPTGLVAFMVYLHNLTGNYLAFNQVQVAWGRELGMFWTVMFQYLKNPAEIAVSWDFKLLNFAALLLGVTAIVVLFKQRRFSLAVYMLLTVFITSSSSLLQSQARYMMALFPIFLVLSSLGRNFYVDQTLRTVSAALLALMTALFAAHYTLALS
jgi:Gpi18-like mannosyltransferase